MRVNRRTPFLLVTAIALMAALQVSADEIVLAEFTWNGKKTAVTLNELEREISELSKYKREKYSSKESKKEYLTLMAESKLVLKAARKKKYDTKPELLEKVEDYRHELMVDKITDEMVDSNVNVSENEMRSYYEKHKDEFIEPEQVRLTCITIQAEKGKEEEAKKKAENILKRIKEGEDIKIVAKEISDKGENMGPGGRNGGDTGFFSRESFSMAEKFTKAAFSLQPGQMYDDVLEQEVRGTVYYMVFRCEEKKPQRQKEFEEEDVQRTIKRKLEQQEKEEYKNEWISRLKTKARMKVYPERIPEDVETAEKSPDKIILAEFKWGSEKYKTTLQDLKESISEMPKFKQSRYKGQEGVEKRLDEMLEETLKLKTAEGKGYDTDSDIARKTTEYLNQLILEKFVEDEVDSKVNLSEEEMKVYYEDHKDEFVEPEQIRLTCITIQAEEGKEEEAKKKAENILKRVKKGEDIKTIAKEISDKGENRGPGGRNQGDTGFFSRKRFSRMKKFTEAAFSLQPGQMYDDVLEQEVRGTVYYMVFRCEEKKPQRQKRFEEEDVQKSIKRKMEKKKRSQLLKSWLDGLKEKSDFKIYFDRL